jgi:outer membrane protein assembly factor BamB
MALFHVEDGTLVIGDRKIDFLLPVAEAIVVGDEIIVRVEPPSGTVFNRNVFALTKQGTKLWQIQESPHGTYSDKPYVGVHLDAEGRIVASNWNGVDYIVDGSSGTVTAKAFNK